MERAGLNVLYTQYILKHYVSKSYLLPLVIQLRDNSNFEMMTRPSSEHTNLLGDLHQALIRTSALCENTGRALQSSGGTKELPPHLRMQTHHIYAELSITHTHHIYTTIQKFGGT